EVHAGSCRVRLKRDARATVRFPPDSDLTTDIAACLKRAQQRKRRMARNQFQPLNELWRTRRDTIASVRLTLAPSRMRIAPHSDILREAPRLRLTRDDAFVASARRSVEKFGSCERSDFLLFHHHDTCRVPAPRPKIRR